MLGVKAKKRFGCKTKIRGEEPTDTKIQVGLRGNTTLLLFRPLSLLKFVGTHVYDVASVK